MWTKGNKNGEWEVYSDGIISVDKSGHNQDVLTPKVSDVPECSSCANESFSVANPYIKFENHDARLIELAPRMAEALLTWYNAPYGDEASKEFSVLCKELHKMKHGEK